MGEGHYITALNPSIRHPAFGEFFTVSKCVALIVWPQGEGFLDGKVPTGCRFRKSHEDVQKVMVEKMCLKKTV